MVYLYRQTQARLKYVRHLRVPSPPPLVHKRYNGPAALVVCCRKDKPVQAEMAGYIRLLRLPVTRHIKVTYPPTGLLSRLAPSN